MVERRIEDRSEPVNQTKHLDVKILNIIEIYTDKYLTIRVVDIANFSEKHS